MIFPRLMIVDDDSGIREFVQLLIEAAIPSAKISAHDCGQCAWEEIQRGETHLLITDYKMPGMDGPELVKTLRSRRFTFPVIMISGMSDVRGLGEAVGVDLFIEKTHLARELAGAMQDLLPAA